MSDADVGDVLSASERRRLKSHGVGDADADLLTVTCPFTGENLGTVPANDAGTVEGAVDRARAAQSDWADRPVAERAAIVSEVGDRVLDARKDLMDLVQVESGKARLDAHEELLDVVVTADHYADAGPSILASRRHEGAIPLLTKTVEHRRPVGVVGLIAPWNYPLTLAVSDALPALVAGNAVVLKPATETPFTALAAARILHEVGVPEDVFQVVTGTGEGAGEPLARSADFVGFTGSVEVGRKVGAIAGERLIDASLELGGKNPAIVCADAPLGRTVSGLARACFANAGQLCISIERVYVEESIFEAFRDRFVDRVAGLDLGTSLDYEADVGSLISEDQLERVENHLADAVEKGATVETGGSTATVETGGNRATDVGPLFFEPTVLTDVPDSAHLADEETFGPVIRIEPVPDVETAIKRANDTDFGLHASVWTGDTDRGREIAARIDCGTVAVNDGYVATWGSTGAPMGGVGDSGVGRRHGREGIAKYTEGQTVAVQRGHPIAPPAGVPTRYAARGLTAAVSLLRRVRRRIGGRGP